jgi:hypothetical protein
MCAAELPGALTAGLARHLRANLIAYLALFVALSGTAWAASKIGSGDIRNDAILSRHIKNGQVASDDLGKGSVTGPKVANGSLTGADVRAATLPGGEIHGVDAAAVGGIAPAEVGGRAGRSSFGPSPCATLNPRGDSRPANCGEVQLTLQHPGRLLISASANATGGGTGKCFVRSGHTYNVPESEMDAAGTGMIARSFVSDPLAAGSYDLILYCTQTSLNWTRPMIAAVQLGNG